MKWVVLICGLLSMYKPAMAQEFPRGEFIMHFKMHNGMVTNFRGSFTDAYVGGFQLVPQFTVVKDLLRLGVIADGYYTAKKLQAAFGPTVSFKLKTLNLKSFGSGGNINISFDHLWGSQKQRLFGGAVNLDLLNLFVVGISLHRDYNLNNWWLQGSFGFRISKVKQPVHP